VARQPRNVQNHGVDESLPVPPLQFPSSSLARKMHGYDRAATESLFAQVAASYEAVWLECARLREKIAEMEQQLEAVQTDVDRYEDQKRLLGEAMIDTKRSAAAIQEEARQEAAAIKEEARREAEALVRDARAEADTMIEKVEPQVQAKAEEILSSAEQERDRLEGEIERLREFSNDTQHELFSFLVAALKWHKSSVAESERIPEAEALEEMLGDLSIADSGPTRAESDLRDDAAESKPKRLTPPRLSPPP
jgi:cell division septum initiation protein DivIVA